MTNSKRMAAAAAMLLGAATGAQADGGWLDDISVSAGGFVRLEVAGASTRDTNPANQLGNAFNGRSVPRQAYTPPALAAGLITWDTLPYNLSTDASSPGLRPMPYEENDVNYSILRGELEVGMTLTPDLQLIGRLRAIYDPGEFYEEFDADTLNVDRGGITGGDPALYRGRPNYFEYRVEGDAHPNPLEWAVENYLVYFPALIFDYNRGPLNVRVGNQQIAWGQAIFFRVFDVVDGLDLRRHLVLDYAQEEYADERVPALGLRVGYQFSDALLADAFIQKFQPTVYGNPNTPYNVIPVQFTVHDRYSEGGWDDEYSYGLRLKANYGQWGFQAMAVQRYNPDGVFRWTASGVDKDLPGGPLTLGGQVNALLALEGLTSGELMAQTPLEASPGGVYSANEWYNYSAWARLDGTGLVNALIHDFPAARQLFASPVETYEQSFNQLNTFFIAGGSGLRGHIAREYFQEEVYGLGASYVTEGEPGSLFDQLIINLEVNYTPDRVFTAPDLNGEFVKDDAWVGALVMEKYFRFTQAFPATYFVFQYMHRSVDDLFGRHLSGYGGTEDHSATGVSGGSNYYVFAFQQPFPQDIYRAGFALLYDQRGSMLVQPGIKWKPSGAWTVEAFYTHVWGSIGGAEPSETLLSTIDHADELTLRLAYQF
ncbi:MAG: DUF1302 family protein [Pseudomonadota bacterium]|nr:DUF1302 family protein [Pseudomonadota bacterium]